MTIEPVGPALGALKWLGGLFFKRFATGRSQSREHDIAVFKRGEKIVTEAMLKDFLNRDLYNRWCRLRHIKAVAEFCFQSRLEGNQFLDARVRQAAVAAADALSRVDGFVAEHFHVTGDDGEMMQLHPYLAHGDDEARERYEGYAAELDGRCAAAWAAYREYRAAVRDRLKV